MTLTLHLPDEFEDELRRVSSENQVTPDEYAAEMLYQMLSERRHGAEAELENRPDWQQSLDRARADREAGRVIPHEKMVRWNDGRSK